MLLILLVMSFRGRFRRGNALRPINRIKHVRDRQLGLVLGVQVNELLIVARDAPVLAITNEVETGSTINGIYLKVEISATSAGALANAYMIILKSPGGSIGNPAANLVGANDNKRFVIHQEMIMMEQSVNGNPRTLFNGVIVIPRGYRRFGPNDELRIGLLVPGVNANVCYQSHYKEFR